MSLSFIKKIGWLFSVICFMAGLTICVYASAGELDTSFNKTGTARLAFGYGSDGAYGIAVQTDGKIVAAGYATFDNNKEFAVARYNPDGTLDTSFGADGIAVIGIENTEEQALAVALQADGKIVAVGKSTLNNIDSYAIVRFNANGTPDSLFGNDGVIISPMGNGESFGSAVAIQGDGKIVTTGFFSFGFTLIRHNTDGSLDSSFGNNGIATLSLGTYSAVSFALAIQPDNKIMVGGFAANLNYHDFALARFTENGTVDKRFGLNGKVIASVSASNDGINSLAVEPGGKIVAAGYAYGQNSYPKFAVARFMSNGRLDTSFGTGGKTVTIIGNNDDQIHSVAVQPNGAIVAVGKSYDGDQYRIVIVRYKADGALDDQFGSGGKVVTPYQNGAYAFSAALQTDGKILTCGLTAKRSSGDFAVFRYNTDGRLDTSFGTDGKAVTDIGNAGGVWNCVLVQNDGKIVAVGYVWDDYDRNFALARYNSDGTLDATFGENGKVLTRISTGGSVATKAVFQPDGKIIVAGQGGNGYAIARYNTDGSLDASFGNKGVKVVRVGVGINNAHSLDIQTDGKIVVSGIGLKTVSSDTDFATVRCNPDGSPDSSFGDAGIVWTSVGSYDEARAVKIQRDNKIVVSGYAFNTAYYNRDFATVRYNSDGSLDSSFGINGIVITPVGTKNDEANALEIQPDGKILVAGISQDETDSQHSRFTVVRYRPNGALDKSFDRDGQVITSIDGESWATSLRLQADGKILVGGSTAPFAATFYDFAIARYNSDGSLDGSFGTDSELPGTVALDFGNTPDANNAIAIQADGKIVGAGVIARRLGVARFLGN